MCAKISPCCILLVDTDQEMPEDELYLYRIWIYTIYYGPNGPDHLMKILPDKPLTPCRDRSKMLFYSSADEDLVFSPEYDEYEKIFYGDMPALYQYIVVLFRGRSNWLFKNSPGKP